MTGGCQNAAPKKAPAISKKRTNREERKRSFNRATETSSYAVAGRASVEA
jgi:hypothetical protein